MGWCLLYAGRADLACFRFHLGIQESSLAEYPFHHIRKDCLVRVLQWHRIFLTLYSSFLLIRSGGGDGKLVPWTVFSQ